MNAPLIRPAVATLCGSLALLALLGATAAVPGNMYVRLSATHAAAVSVLSYDGIATVPQQPGTPAALLPPDRVEATLVTPAVADGAFAGNGPHRYASWTVVEMDSHGKVVRRTIFHGVTIRSISADQTGAGADARRVRFSAASVTVSLPADVVMRAGDSDRH